MEFSAGGGAINWFPGHMAAAMQAIRERLKLANMVIEVKEARIPLSPANQNLQPQLSSNRRIISLKKKDLANPNILICEGCDGGRGAYCSISTGCFEYSGDFSPLEAVE